MKRLTAQQVDSYHRDGFLFPVPAFSREEAAALLAKLEQTEAKLGASMSQVERKWRGASYAYLAWVNALTRDPRILDVVEDLLGPDLLVYTATFFIKEAGAPTFAAWHQDATYFGLEPHEHVTAWIALTDANHEAGCMEVLPWNGAPARQLHHAAARLANSINGAGQVIVEPMDVGETVAMALEAGQFSLHHTLCRHRSAPNRAAHRRVGFGISYIPAHVRTTGTTRVPALLVRGRDHGTFDLLPSPTADFAPDALAVLEKAYQCYSEHYAEQIRMHAERFGPAPA
jgi:ectoine hydroxylase-related dioxygenase (phytanoyl-CoA dioxygenase family)